jgi:hypothetical protein
MLQLSPRKKVRRLAGFAPQRSGGLQNAATRFASTPICFEAPGWREHEASAGEVPHRDARRKLSPASHLGRSDQPDWERL